MLSSARRIQTLSNACPGLWLRPVSHRNVPYSSPFRPSASKMPLCVLSGSSWKTGLQHILIRCKQQAWSHPIQSHTALLCVLCVLSDTRELVIHAAHTQTWWFPGRSGDCLIHWHDTSNRNSIWHSSDIGLVDLNSIVAWLILPNYSSLKHNVLFTEEPTWLLSNPLFSQSCITVFLPVSASEISHAQTYKCLWV